MSKQILIYVFIFMMIFTLGCLDNSIEEPNEKDIISKFTEHQMSIRNYSGELFTEPGTQSNLSEYCRVFIKYPGKFKAEYISSYTRNNGTISILNGSRLIEYDPLNNRTLVFETNPEGNSLTALDYQGLLKKIIPVGNISYLGVGFIDNKSTYILDIKPEDPEETFNEKYSAYQISLAKVWVDPESWTAKKIELYGKEGLNPVVTVNYLNLTVNGEIQDNIFSSEQYLQYEITTPPIHPPQIFETG